MVYVGSKKKPVSGSEVGMCLPMVQCSPFQPCSHSHFPSLQVPCFTQSGLHTRWSQAVPVQPSSQRQEPPMHTPCVPQSTEQTSDERREEHNLHSLKIRSNEEKGYAKTFADLIKTCRLTDRTIRAHPIGVTATDPCVWNKGTMTMALIWALCSGQLTAGSAPSWFTVALSIHTDAII